MPWSFTTAGIRCWSRPAEALARRRLRQADFQQVGLAGRGLAHRHLAVLQVIQNRGVRAGELAPPVLTCSKEAAVAPAGQGSFAHAQVFTGLAGRGSEAGMTGMHRLMAVVPAGAGDAPEDPGGAGRVHGRLSDPPLSAPVRPFPLVRSLRTGLDFAHIMRTTVQNRA
jgi:hypothetical protein